MSHRPNERIYCGSVYRLMEVRQDLLEEGLWGSPEELLKR